jgi:hypothetical protein
MASWAEFEAQAPDLAASVRRFFDAHVHKTMATLRRDGSPRISGTEVQFTDDGELTIGSMWQAVKALDLQRDGRFALHSGSDDPPGWSGDAKVAGRMVEVTPAGATSHTFRAELVEASVVELGDPADHLVITSWREGRGVTTRRR